MMLVAAQLAAAELKVDHVTVAGRSLSEMRKRFASVGIRTEFGGKHSNGMTEMALASFPDGSYLELMAAQPGASLAGDEWREFIEKQAGPCGWAIRVADMEAEAERLNRAGITLDPAAGGRQRPDGVPLRWTTADIIGPGLRGSFFPFLIEDETPRAQRVYLHGRPSAPAFGGVALVVVAVRDLDGAVERWRAVFGLAAPERSTDDWFGARLAWFPGTPVVLAAAQGPDSWIAARLRAFGEAPCAFVLRASGGLPKSAKHSRGTWFGHAIGWFDPAALAKARIGVQQ